MTNEEWRKAWRQADVCLWLAAEGWRVRTIKNPTTWADVYATYSEARRVVDALGLKFVVGR